MPWVGFPTVRRPDAGTTSTTRPTVLAAVPFSVPSWVVGTCRDLVVDYGYSVQHANASWQPGPSTFYVWAVAALLPSTFTYSTLLASDTWQASAPAALDMRNTTWPRARYERANLTAGPGLATSGTFYLGMFFEQAGYGTAVEAGVRAQYDPSRRPFLYVDASANFLADPLLSAPQVMFTAAPTHTDYYTFDDDFSTATSAGPVTRLWASVALYCPVNMTAVAAAGAVAAVSATKPPFLPSQSVLGPTTAPAAPSSMLVAGVGTPGPPPPAPSPFLSPPAASPSDGTGVDTSSSGLGGSVATPSSSSSSSSPTTVAAATTVAPEPLVTTEEVGIVIGVAVGFFVLVLVILGGYYYWQRRRQSTRRLRDLMRDPATSGGADKASTDDAVMVHLETDANELKPIAPFKDAPDGDEGTADGGRPGPPIVVGNGKIAIRRVDEMPIPGLDEDDEGDEDDDEGDEDDEDDGKGPSRV